MRIFLIVADSFGCGALPDADRYGDEGSNTLRAVTATRRCRMPELERLGIFHIAGNDTMGGVADVQPAAAFGRMAEQSAGKDTVSGHWELAGLISPHAMPVYPNGFSDEIIQKFEAITGRRVLCNKPYSGTEVICTYGQEHLRTGALIVYTSGDSVFQVAAHESVVPVPQLYAYCEAAREMLTGADAVGRVIARPFVGDYPDFVRTSNRRDFCLAPHGDTLLDVIFRCSADVIAVGKIYDIFAGRSITEAIHTDNNMHGMDVTISLTERNFDGLCFVNLVEFDSAYGHRRNADGYADAVSAFDRRLRELNARLRVDDIVVITADHGCDPSFSGTDHTREYVPLLLYGAAIQPCNLGTRATFADLGKTIAELFTNGTPNHLAGTSFASQIRRESHT